MFGTADSELKTYLAERFAKIDVIVIAQIINGQLTYTLDIKSHGNNGKIELPSKSGAHKIKFSLEDDTNLNLRFDAGGPIFASTDTSQCPTTLDTDQIMADSCDDDTLEVIDWNYGQAVDIRYQLNFMSKTGVPQQPLDPIIRNGGGTPDGFNS
jgi:hypothetical protein